MCGASLSEPAKPRSPKFFKGQPASGKSTTDSAPSTNSSAPFDSIAVDHTDPPERHQIENRPIESQPTKSHPVEALKKSDRYQSEPVEQHMNDEDEGRSQLNNDFLDDDLHIDEDEFENNLYSEEDDLQDDELSTLRDLSFNQNENLASSSKLTCSRSSFSRNFSARTSP